jgi:hypothetical protein
MALYFLSLFVHFTASTFFCFSKESSKEKQSRPMDIGIDAEQLLG